MAAVPPPTGSAQPQPAPHNDTPAPLTPLSWEGEKMFNIYIYDYCYKRGFRKTARELMQEADISTDPKPPINARQGLLFEWWSVFWVLFQAKSNGGGSEDALLYTQHQQQQQPRTARAPGTLPPTGMAGQPPQPPMQRPTQLSTGMMNGIGSGLPGQHQLPPGSSPMSFAIGGNPAPQTNGIAAPHPPTPGSAPNQHQHHPHGSQPPNFNPMMQSGQRPQSMNGPPHPQPQNGQQQQQQQQQQMQQQQQQQRPLGTPNHNLPFPSPTMAHSPNVQHPGPHPQGQQAPGPGPQPSPMSNLNGPSPLIMNRGAMMPPNGMHPGMAMGGVPPQPQQVGPPGGPQGPAFVQMPTGRPPSRTNTPQMQPGMMHNSPSMAARQVMMHGGEFSLNNDLQRLQPGHVQQAKMECGIPLDKDPALLTANEKRKIVEYCMRRYSKQPTTPGGPSTPMMPPPNLQQRPPQQQQQQQQHHQQQLQQHQQHMQQQQQQRMGKRNSTSPGEDPDNQSADSSPPDRKRPRRSPMDNAAMIPKGATPLPYPQTPQQLPAAPPQGQGHPPQGPPGHLPQQPPPTGMPPQMMIMQRNMGPQGGQMQPMGMNGHIPPPGMSMQGQQGPPPQGQQGMGNMQGQMGPHGHMGPPIGMVMQGQMPYRVPLHQVHNAPGMMQGQPNAGSPAGPDPASFVPGGPHPGGLPQGGQQQFNPGMPLNRMLEQKPPQGRPGIVPPPPGAVGAPGSMMPPPSPANGSAALKEAQKDAKPMLDGSPRGGPGQPNQMGGPSQQQQHQQQMQQQGQPPGTQHQIQHPGTPGPQGQPQQPGPQGVNPQGPQGQQPGGPGSLSGVGMATSPTSNLGGGLMSDTMLFSTDFTDFDPSLFGADPNIDFDREFGTWFNPEDTMGSALDMK